jgi:fatty-acyl-CoA synthase
MVLTEIFDPKETMEIIEQEKITTIFGTPPMFAMMMDHADFRKRNLSSLRTGAIGGSSIPPSLFRKVVSDMGVRDIISGYGLSEAGALSNSTFPEDTIEDRAETVGIALPSFRVKVVDPKTGITLPAGDQGEIWLHDVYTGSALGKGYYNMHNKSSEVFLEDGWFRTGDLGIMDDRGYLKITGRLKDMALVGGFNVYPAEVENFLATHPKVQQAFVLGVPDKRLGEVVMAYIVPKNTGDINESEIMKYCSDNIGNYKVPKYIKFIDISEVPFSGHEKVQKYKLRERAIKEFGLEELK